MPLYPPPSSGSGAPADAKYIVQELDAGLSAEQALGALATGILKSTTTTGVVSIAGAGTDYYNPGGTDVAITDGGTGQSTAQAAIDALSAVAGATAEHVLTKDTATGNAIFKVAPGFGSGAPTTVDYLVGTADATLSAEIVVGTTPGGELGGTWASPTVDASHSGSTHAATQAAAEATAAAALAAALATNSHGPVSLDSLVSYWTLNEASGTRYDSHGTNHLTDVNSVGSAAGIISNAAHFVATSSETLSVADNSSLGFTTAMSVSFWLNQTDLGTDRALIGKWTYQTDGEFVIQTRSASYAGGTAGDLSIFIATSAADSGSGCTMNFDDVDMVAGTWYHVAVVYDGSLSGNANRLKVWINNVQKTLTAAAGAVPATMLDGGATFYLGRFGGSLTRYYNGDMDEVSLWSQALASDDVARLHNGGVGLYVDLTNGVTGTLPIANGGTGNTTGSGWTDDGTSVRLTTITDSVGIGTTSPETKLQVSGTNNTTGISIEELATTGSRGTLLDFINANSGGTDAAGKIRFYANISTLEADISAITGASGSTSGALAFSTNASSVYAERMRIHSNGTVGIGTAAPAAKLAINGGLHVGGDSDPGDNNAAVDGTLAVTGVTTFGAPATLKGYTVATLPAGVVGHTAYVTDALAPVFIAIIAGGGAVTCPVFYNGANWVAF